MGGFDWKLSSTFENVSDGRIKSPDLEKYKIDSFAFERQSFF